MNSGENLQITSREGHADRPSWTRDGHIVYESQTSGNRDLWIMASDGSNAKQLAFDPGMDTSPSASPRGDHIFFASNRTGTPHIWSIQQDGTNPKQLTAGGGEGLPDSSPAGAWVVYESTDSGRPVLWKVQSDGGTPVQLTNELSRAPAISPDGKLIAFYYWDELPGSPIRLAIIPSDGGRPIKTFDFPGIIHTRIVRWAPDGKALTYVANEGGVSNRVFFFIGPERGLKPRDYVLVRVPEAR
jgi:Tol biopolymer transport system component